MFWTVHFIAGAIIAIAVLVKIVIDYWKWYDCVDFDDVLSLMDFHEYVLVIALFLGGYVSFIVAALVVIIRIMIFLIASVIRYIEKKRKGAD